LDRAPAQGEWTLRETLAHAIGVERSYRANTQHALARREDEPLKLPPDRRPQPDPADTSGGVLDILAAFAARRADTDDALAGLDVGVGAVRRLASGRRPLSASPLRVAHRRAHRAVREDGPVARDHAQ
ncbi:MAG: hypothetical protein E6I44_03340, partial [Chloroflexi bacterium]